MARFGVVVVGRPRVTWANDAVADYARRIQRLGGVREEVVKPERFRGDVEAVRDAEAERVRRLVGDRGRLVVLDERGDRCSTEAFAGLVDDGRQAGTVWFVIGGPYGHGQALREGAWRVVRLSDLVLNHEVARVVLYEQLYRALTLLEGHPYHH
ncbi:MAG: 23S rRNA (pseudouridine(1915)-N(3))-methyltransferase RlmH [Myxococcota bacterium]